MTTPSPEHCWYRLTPDRLVVGLLAVEGFLLLCERFGWFAFNRRPGWTVLIALAAIAAAFLVLTLWFAAGLVLRWRFQYGLRSLLLLVLAVAVGCSWMATEMQRARKQEEAVKALAGLRGATCYDFDRAGASWQTGAPSAPHRLLELLGTDFFAHVAEARVHSAAGLDCLEGLPQLEELYIDGADVTDAGLTHLEGLSRLQCLSLHNSQVGDAGLAHLEHLGQLGTLSLWGARVTDAGLVHLRGMGQLQSLMLTNTRVADVGLVHLERLSKLENLFLDNTQVTDAGLVHLGGMRQLRWLYVTGTKVTDEGAEKLRQALPNCKIAY